MKHCRILFLLALCSLFLLTLASANIVLDEDFSDDTPFTDLARGADGTTTPTLESKGINVTDESDDPSQVGDLAYNTTSGSKTQGELFTIDAAHNGRCWKLSAAQQLFWGQSGVAGEPSGMGTIACNGDGTQVQQVAVAVEPETALKAAGTNVGSISYFFSKLELV
jgi:hypothetical protein